MRVAVAGSTGHTGTQVVRQALARGHEVIAVARHPAVAARQDARLVSMAGDVLDQKSMIRALADAEGVVSALGIGASRNPTVVYSQGTANILRAMDANAIRKLAVISAAPVAPRAEQTGSSQMRNPGRFAWPPWRRENGVRPSGTPMTL